MPREYEQLAPGERTEVSASEIGLDDGALGPDERYEENKPLYQLYTALEIGGYRPLRPRHSVRHPVTREVLRDRSYLQRLPGETIVDPHGVDVYVERLRYAAHDPIAWRIISVYVDTLFRQSVQRDSVRDVLGDEIVDDVTLQGDSIDDWIPDVFGAGLGQGWLVGLVDFPRYDGAPPPSLAHAESMGARPYAQIIRPLRIYRIELDEYRNIISMLVHEGRDLYRYWTIEGCILYRRVQRGYEIVDVVSYDYGRVPAELFVALPGDDSDPLAPIGESAMRATALIDLEVLNHMSLVDDLTRKTGFPILHANASEDVDLLPKNDVPVGPDRLFMLPAELSWIATDPANGSSLREHIDWLESIAYKIGGVHRRSQDSVEAHSGLALDYESSPIYATVQSWARKIRNFEIRLWRLMAAMMGKSSDQIASITATYPEDFTVRPAAADISQASAIASVYGGYGQCPQLVQVGVDALVRRAITRLVGQDPIVREALASASAISYQYNETDTLDDADPDVEDQVDESSDQTPRDAGDDSQGDG